MDGSHGPLGAICPRCSAELPRSDSFECVACWFAIASTEREPTIDGYRLLGTIGEGGSAVVHLALRVEKGDLFALKVAKPGAPHASVAFQNELNNARRLQGSAANVVKVYDHGRTKSGEPFLVMELMEGGTLAQAVEAGKYASRRDVLTLVAKLARMLASAHARAVLHCDLKPDNILFDAKGEPHLADFGISQQLEGPAAARVVTVGGTWGWMSPEQARSRLPTAAAPTDAGERSPLTIASDVFSLGVVLYWLLTRTLPFGCDADFDRRVQLKAPVPSAARRLFARELEWECSMICQRALEREVGARYQTAAELADDALRALTGLPLLAERSQALRRLACWVNRHKLLSFAGLQLMLLLLYVPLVPFLVLGQSRALLQEQNSNAALHQAGAIMNELRDYAERLLSTAERPEIRALVSHPDPYVPAPALATAVAGYVDNFILLSSDGRARARWPIPETRPTTVDFSFRDYFQGAAQLGREGRRQIYVPRVIRSKTRNRLSIELTTPLFDDAGNFSGILGNGFPARSTFGAVQMNCTGSGRCMTGLLAARDRDEPGAPLPEAIIFIAAPELRIGQEAALETALSRKICDRIGCTPQPRDQFLARPNVRPLVEDFLDPVTGRRLFGAFAPVGGTGLVVVVTTPTSAVRELTDRMLENARSYLGVPMLLGVMFFGALLASLRLRGLPPVQGT